MIYQSLFKRVLILLAFVALMLPVQAQEANLEAGKTIFLNNCASCHNKNMKDDLTGPALGGSEERWGDDAALYSWIRNSQALIATGHPYANEIYNKWNKVAMTSFALSDEEIANVLAYIDGVYTGAIGGPPVPPGGSVAEVTEARDNTSLYIVLALVLAILAVVLARVASNLRYLSDLKDGKEVAERRTLVEILTSKGVVTFAIFALVVLGGYTTVSNAVSLGRQQGYQPEQPIKFSHATHSGIHKIDCQYCHDGARRSKQSVIPAANTCMNCHSAIKVGSQYGTAELTKIYASIGYDPNTGTYVEDYDNMPESEIKSIYTKWIADTYVKSENANMSKVDKVVEDQWKGIVKALKNPDNGDDKIQGPIEWVRIHNLADHAYFNHAQHVSVGKVECQTCHGKVEEMEVVAQHSPLSMGWCINCHRQTEVKFADNDYYKSYTRYHEELAKGERTKVTVEDVGGLECQKCHY